ncbi:MAG: hypothetical protein ABIO60_10405 [Aquaticitalea sp.]
MKNLLMIAVALVTLNASAQERKQENHKGDMKDKMEMRQDMTPEEIAQLQTKKMTLHLDLSATQQSEVEKVLLAEAKDRKSKMEAFKVKKEAGDEKRSKNDRLKMQNERLDHQIALKKKMKGILNADQYEKFEKMQEKRDGKRGKQMRMERHKE